MAKNRKNQAAAIRFGPALKASFLCLLIGGSGIGFVWEKGQNYQLGQQIHQREVRLNRLQADNKQLDDQIAFLRSPVMLDRRVKELQLGLAPMTPLQVVRLVEPIAPPPTSNPPRQLVQRTGSRRTP